MERENVLYRIEGDFGFNTGDKDIGIVTEKLGIEPTWSWNKGEKYFVKKINEFRYRSNGIWGYDANPIFIDDTNISLIIQHFRELLSDKLEIINELITKYQFECNISITVYFEKEEYIYYGSSISKEEMLFLSNFSNFSISYLQVENVEE